MKADLSGMSKKWPSSEVARQEVPKFTGGAISEKYLANLDSQGLGPKGRYKLGRRVVYPVSSLIEWLENRSQVLEKE
jgi:hypothetical protein